MNQTLLPGPRSGVCFLKMGESRHVSVYIFFDDS